jgi:hypothetical protein
VRRQSWPRNYAGETGGASVRRRPSEAYRLSSAAFYTTPSEPDIHQSMIDYIAAFMPDHSGKNFNPHVTIGVCTTAFLDALLAQPFIDFTF